MKKYEDHGKAYFEKFSSNDDNEWIVNNDRTELYKYVDEEWLKKYYYDLEVSKNSEVANKFINDNFKREYSKRIEEVENPNYGKGGGRHRGPHAGPRPPEYITHIYWDHLAKLKGSFLDFKNLTLIAKQFKPDNYYITVLEKDKWTYNNFGVEINVELDKENFKNKMNNLKNKFDESPEKLKMFQSLLINAIRKLNTNQENKDEAEKYFENKIIDATIWNMLYHVFKNEINKFIELGLNKDKKNYTGLKFSDLQTHYRNGLDSNWVDWKTNSNLTNVFNIWDIELTITKEITYYNDKPIFYNNDDKNKFINLSNKTRNNNDYFDCINLNEKINKTEIMNVQDTIKEQNDFSLKRKIGHVDDYSNYFNLEGLQTFKFKNFIQYKETKDNSLVYQLNNSYSSLTTFKDDAEITGYLRKIKIDGIKPIARYIIVGLESTLSSHGIKMLFNELGFNDPSTITNNYRAILQKLILPSTEKIFYVNNGHKYLMDLKYFNLWNIELNKEKYYFANSRDVTKFIIKYVNLNAKPIIRNGVK
ncbi:hypothetical protein [Metamycoplasma hyosynoviae]|nr:hypothetical protein [Metamycoplasma hyosynoviae]